MAKRTRVPARRVRATQTKDPTRKTARKTVRKTAPKTAPKTASKAASKSSAVKTEQAILARRRVYTPELLAHARQRFEQTEDSLADIEAELDVRRDTIRSIAKREGWTRYLRPPQGLPAAVSVLAQAEALERHPELRAGDQGVSAAVSAPAEGEGATPPLADTIARLHRVVLSELAALESLRTQLNRRPRGSTGAIRTLAALTETLQKLQRSQPSPANTGSDDADIPADIDEFRNELARRIDMFVIERTDAGDGSGAVAPSVDAAV